MITELATRKWSTLLTFFWGYLTRRFNFGCIGAILRSAMLYGKWYERPSLILSFPWSKKFAPTMRYNQGSIEERDAAVERLREFLRIKRGQSTNSDKDTWFAKTGDAARIKPEAGLSRIVAPRCFLWVSAPRNSKLQRSFKQKAAKVSKGNVLRKS
jgi:hypothetical protein